MLGRLKRFLVLVDDIAEVLIVHVLFSRRHWKKTTGALAAVAVLVLVGLGLFSPRTTSSVADHQTLARRGHQALKKGQYAKAVGLFHQAVARAPKVYRYREQLGLAQLRAEQYESAVQTFLAARRIEPTASSLYYLGCAFQGLKMHDAAIGFFTQVKGVEQPHPADRRAIVSPAYGVAADVKIAESLLRKGETARARTMLTRILASYPTYAPARFHLGIAYWETGALDRAAAEFFKVVETCPRESSAHYNIACYYSIRGATSLALTWLERALDAGFRDFAHMATDHDLDAIRGSRYQELVTRYQARARKLAQR